MTESEAINFFKDFIETLKINGEEQVLKNNYCKSANIAIKALEKQIPKKPFYTFSEDEEILASCEICDSNIDWTYQGYWRKGQPNYCKNCGQKLDWSDTE